MQHFMIDNMPDKKERYKFLIEPGIDAYQMTTGTIRTESDGTGFPFCMAAPGNRRCDLVIERRLINLFKDLTQIKESPLMNYLVAVCCPLILPGNDFVLSDVFLQKRARPF
jgi:hypothetical protein